MNAPFLALALLRGALGLPPAAPVETPFGLGERFEYSAKLGILSLGSAAIEVSGVEAVRGDSAWRFRFSLEAGNALFRISSRLESWTRARDFQTLRFQQWSKENNKEYKREYEVYGDSGYYRPVDGENTPTPSDPLDDASILYYVRTAPLEVGRTYRLERYFRPEKNPIVLKVLKRETMELPDGSKVPCLVLNPVVGDRRANSLTSGFWAAVPFAAAGGSRTTEVGWRLGLDDGIMRDGSLGALAIEVGTGVPRGAGVVGGGVRDGRGGG